ncbi:asparagine synthase (glutamine-hydrolyzing) [Hahella sp. CCB-MM4]|uniref:asparagine synthase (glutamine-hydrolyzing) n=1 Tax=Hahella sp. (strain CCB-MM4) TaxID=1926491 RepID=UPI000B9C6BA1|nr:asparagine synthase (glutamine-hydrolyzing) [Hahella sp. CCB-MM4]OZG73435.1 asparagine synthase (glutamine-hydrolyzing) [Hahella sp. CCB-MM4]
MCGIAGFTKFDMSVPDESMLKAMGDVIQHRGPDAYGIHAEEGVGLCHRRLSIVDLSEAGNQPMKSANERYLIVFNGEIYNFLELREALVKEGYPFQNKTDTEVILALYEKEGEKCLDHLNGMFAFAIWDRQEKSLFLARDRIGKKPLYYYYDGTDLYFASEMKSLLTIPTIPTDIRVDAVYDFFAYQYVPDPKTIFKDIHKLEPGHYLKLERPKLKLENPRLKLESPKSDGEKLDNPKLEKKQYWDVSFATESSKPEAEIKKDLLDLLTACTKRRMIADVPLGAFLSGGIDSSGVVALMANNSDKPVKTCSIGFDEKKFNETEFAKIVADKYKTEHHEFTVHQNVKDNLEKIVAFFDEPFADPSLVPTYFVSELARQQVTVAVAGDGGDEVFAGYEKYSIDDIENRLRNKFPRFIRKKIFPPLANLLAKSNNTLCRKGKTLLTSLSLEPEMGFYLSNAQIDDRQWNRLVNTDTRSQLGDYHPSRITTDAYHRADGRDHLARILYTDMKTYLPGGILVKVDRMSMANSLEVRAPILDKEVLEFSATLSSSLKFRDGEKKYILKETFKQLLPDDILYRKKMGFSVPLAIWLRTELKELASDYLFSKGEGIQNFFNMDEVKSLWSQHQEEKADHSAILWSMLMFQMWWYQYMQLQGRKYQGA